MKNRNEKREINYPNGASYLFPGISGVFINYPDTGSNRDIKNRIGKELKK